MASEGIFEVRRQCARHGLDDPWEYYEHWYWCYFSLEILLHKWGNIHTRSSELLHSLWKVIHHAIKTVSDSSRPTSNLCLEQLFKVRYALKSQLSKATALPGEYRGFGTKNVADVLEEALDTVDKAIQDSYLVWSIPYVLDPRYKLRSLEDNFKRVFGSEDAECYTSCVRGKLQELYTRYIQNDNDMQEDDDEVSNGNIEEMAIDSSTTPLEQSRDDSHAEAKTELDLYLQDSPARQTKDFNILKWWKVNGSDQYPTVAQMARDALAMPTCSKLTSDQIAHVRSMLRGY